MTTLTLKTFPQEVGKVAEDSLKEQDKADPLVPGMSDLIPLLVYLNQVLIFVVDGGEHGAHTRMSSFETNPACDL